MLFGLVQKNKNRNGYSIYSYCGGGWEASRWRVCPPSSFYYLKKIHYMCFLYMFKMLITCSSCWSCWFVALTDMMVIETCTFVNMQFQINISVELPVIHVFKVCSFKCDYFIYISYVLSQEAVKCSCQTDFHTYMYDDLQEPCSLLWYQKKLSKSWSKKSTTEISYNY